MLCGLPVFQSYSSEVINFRDRDSGSIGGSAAGTVADGIAASGPVMWAAAGMGLWSYISWAPVYLHKFPNKKNNVRIKLLLMIYFW